jgi:hypothetical protein
MKIIKGKYAPVTGYSKDLVAIIAGCLTLVRGPRAEPA